MTNKHVAPPLSEMQVEQFIADGFIRIDDAFPRPVAEEARALLWRDTGCDPDRRETWTKPVVRLGMYGQQPFLRAANMPTLHQAFDQLIGPGQWLPCRSMGTFPIRFPSHDDPGDTGWHVDVSFGFEDSADFMSWRVNLSSRGRALLMLFLFSDVGENAAPTRIRLGSHRDIARRLALTGDEGLTLHELAADGFESSAHRQIVLATGETGTVYLRHPFLVHAAQPHMDMSRAFSLNHLCCRAGHWRPNAPSLAPSKRRLHNELRTADAII
ncbi:hypothetical protein QBC99_000104 [Beijerinckia sp. GAS462]|nr:hypothetical protein [Beijerinckia sp. GAS462]SEB52012.1 Phytanoyl-CoA dioxygenase (PhyH) [Beijerinckia sp. 28-YEA-48]